MELGRKERPYGKGKKWTVLVRLDVKNALNSVFLGGIIQAL